MGRYTGKKCRLVSMFGLTSSFFLVEIIVGYVTNSMALVADSFHMLSDIAALTVAFISVKMAPKSWNKNTYGWARAEVLGALVNAVFLVALCFSISVESLKRFYDPEEIHDPQMILIVGALGLLVNLLGLLLFAEHGHSHGGHGHSHGKSSHGAHSHLTALADDDGDEDDEEAVMNEKPKSVEDGIKGAVDKKKAEKDKKAAAAKSAGSQMNMRGVFLHVLADALGSVVVIISALIMWLTEWEYKKYVDPALSLVLVCLMMKGVWPLLIESALILLQTVPTHIDVDKLKKRLLNEIDGVLAIHEFHVWQLTGDRIIASAHIRCLNLSEYMKIAENVKEFFHNEGIHSTTIQPEFVESMDAASMSASEDCAIACPRDPTQEEPSCQANKCCPPQKSSQNTPVTERRANGFEVNGESGEQLETRNNKSSSSSPGNSTPNQVASSTDADATQPTPSRRSGPNLSSMMVNDTNKDDTNGEQLPAELDLSDEQMAKNAANGHEEEGGGDEIIMPKAQGKAVRIVSKKSNV